jgi:hypothetical protein
MNHAVDSAAVNSHSTVLFTDPTVFSTLYLNILSQNFLYEFWQSWTNRTWRFMRSSKNRILLMLTKYFLNINNIDRKESVRQVLAQSELLLRRNRRFSRELWFWCLGPKFDPTRFSHFFQHQRRSVGPMSENWWTTQPLRNVSSQWRLVSLNFVFWDSMGHALPWSLKLVYEQFGRI